MFGYRTLIIAITFCMTSESVQLIYSIRVNQRNLGMRIWVYGWKIPKWMADRSLLDSGTGGPFLICFHHASCKRELYAVL